MKIRRILVGIDASAHSLAALEAAASLAARWEAELVGLFVEDINLLRMSALPFAREWGYSSAISRSLDTGAMERALRSAAGRAEQAIAEAGRKSGVPWSFHVSRGSVVSELLSAAGESDLLALGKAGRPLGKLLQLGSTALHLMNRGRSGLLLLQQGFYIRSPVVVWFDGSETASRAMAVAVPLARICDGAMQVVVTAATRAAGGRREQQALGLVPAGSPPVSGRVLVRAGASRVVQTVKELKPGALVLPVGSAARAAALVQRLCSEVPCPVFLVR